MPPRSKPTSVQNHLLLRGSVYHCRIDIPEELRPAFGNRRILSTSLKTGDKLLARELAAVQAGQWKAQFRALREAKIRAGDQWREELARAAKDHHERADTVMLSALKGELIPSNRPVKTYDEIEADLDSQIEEKNALFAYVGQLEQELDMPGLKNELGAIWADGSLHPAEKLRRYSEVQQRVLAHKTKTENHLTVAELDEARTIAKNPSTYKPKSPISTTSIDRFATHYAEQNDNVRTLDVYVSKVTKLSKWLTTNGRELDFDSVAEFLDSVSKQRQTRTGYLAAFRRYHEWACRYDTYYRGLFADIKNPFDGHKHPKVGANAGSGWLAYTQEEAERLQAAALVKGDNDLADLIAFASYTGCRIEELGRIRRETTVFDKTGNPIAFNVDDSKTQAGIREIPIHSRLLPLYLSRLASAHGEKEYLFSGNDDHKHGMRLNALGQRFTKLKRAEGFGDRHVFHSIRKCTATMLLQAGASPVAIPAILGHEYGHISLDVYAAGPSHEQKKEAIEKLVFNFHLTHSTLTLQKIDSK